MAAQDKVSRFTQVLLDPMAVEFSQPIKGMMEHDQTHVSLSDPGQGIINLRFTQEGITIIVEFSLCILITPTHPGRIKAQQSYFFAAEIRPYTDTGIFRRILACIGAHECAERLERLQ